MAPTWTVTLVVACVLCSCVQANTLERRSTACYERIGCFSNNAPFFSTTRLLSVVPAKPSKIKTTFQLYTRANQNAPQFLDAMHPDRFQTQWSDFQASRPTKIVVHGFLDSVFVNHWLNDTKRELLLHGDYNVIIVDWHGGNQLPYTQATANTRLVGAQIADLLQTLQRSKSLKVDTVHIIGHSLGAHIAGYAGERTPGLGRISGLDPAGPYFDGTDTAVRLDPSDANFVDVLHSDAESLLKLGFGTREPAGHVDFYPNLGHNQPGCQQSPVVTLAQNGLVEGVEEVTACSHLRALKFYIESINSRCPFLAVPCDGEKEYKNNECTSCGSGGCSKMGFHADEVKPTSPTKYFLETSDRAPFCEYHLVVDVKMGDNSYERGELKVQIVGTLGSTGWITLNDRYTYFQSKTTYSFITADVHNLGDITSVKVTWVHHMDITNPIKWNPLGLRHPTIFVDSVFVREMEQHKQFHICGTGTQTSIETDHVATFSRSC